IIHSQIKRVIIMNDSVKRLLFVGFIIVGAIFLYQYIEQTQQVHEPSWTEFKTQVENDNIQHIVFVKSPEGNLVALEGEYNQPVSAEQVDYPEFKLAALAVEKAQENIWELLDQRNIEMETRTDEESWWTMLLVNSLPILLIVGIWLYFIHRTRKSMGGGSGMMGVGESKAELYDEETPDVTFDDVAGYSGPKNEVRQVIEFLQNPEKFDRLGGEIPKGILMVGPPGTGKTLTARAIAGEAGVPYLSTEGSDFMEMFVGVGASRVRDLFERAKELSPSIIFIDEIDSVGRKRGAGLGGGHDEREQTLNQLLSEMDGFEPNTGVILIGATNRPDILDPALQRPGRFDRQVTFEMPTLEERKDILKLHAQDKPIKGEVDLDEIASGTPGFSGADLKNLLNEAALLAAEKDLDNIPKEVVDEARDKVLMGLRREEMVISDDEKKTMATHESGHTLVGYFSENTDPVHKVTIIPRGRSLGATQQLPLEEKKMYTREDLMGRLAVLMAGRAAEQLKMETITNGAQDDLRRATKMARKMVLQWGMSPELGNMAYQDNNGNVFLGEEMGNQREYSEKTAEQIDEAVHQIIIEATNKARNILEEYTELLDKAIECLMEKETLNAEEIETLLETGELPEVDEGEEDENKEKTEDTKAADNSEQNSNENDNEEEDTEENNTVEPDKPDLDKLKETLNEAKKNLNPDEDSDDN
ncbi:MAG: ATP-dependent zinc metalloprotease FtsH, partial [bacterium]